MPYDLNATVGNLSGGTSMLQNVNSEIMMGWLGILLLLGLSILFLIIFYQRTGDIKRSLGSMGFICLGFSILFRAMNILPDLAVFIVLIITAGIMAFTWNRD